MKASEIMDGLFALAKSGEFTHTCDTCKSGSPDAEVTKIAVSMFATPEIVREASEWGAQLLIVHEPTYYNHMDVHSDEKIETEKRQLIERSGLTIYRYHDHAHRADPDLIGAGELKYLGLDGEVEHTDIFDLVRVHLTRQLTPRALAKLMEQRLGIRHIRICGAADVPCSEISAMFGTPGGVFDELKRDGTEILMTGEACEWALAEYARDAAQLGHKKTLMILGHIGSERDGMRLVADILTETLKDAETRYFECGEVYTYTDCE